MRRPLRVAVASLLVVLGLLVAFFFAALWMIADCAPACRARGEHAPVALLVGGGVGLALGAVRLGRGARVAWGTGLLAGGILALAAGAWMVAQGERGWIWGALVAAAAATALGAWLARGK